MALLTEITVVVQTCAEVMEGTVVPFGPITEGEECSGYLPIPSLLNILCGFIEFILIQNLLKVTVICIDNLSARSFRSGH